MARLIIAAACILLAIGRPSLHSNAWAATTLLKPQPVVQKHTIVSDCRQVQFATRTILPSGRAGKLYRHQLKTSEPLPKITYRLIKGKLPAGLKLDSQGIISGVAKTSGTFRFVIRASSPCPTHSNRVESSFTIRIDGREKALAIEARPAAFKVTAGNGTRHKIQYTCKIPFSGELRLYSHGAKFMVNKRLIGEVKKALTMSLKGKIGLSSETITVSKALIRKTLGMGAHRITYIRTFSLGNKQASHSAEVIITIVRNTPPKLRTLEMDQPADGNTLDYRALNFRWQRDRSSASYRIEFTAADNSEVLYSDTTKSTSYTLSDGVVSDKFDARASYRWQIKGLDKRGRVVARSVPRGFGFKPIRNFLPGQIIVITRSSRAADGTAAYLGKKYRLRLVDAYAIRSLKRNVTVFSTPDNVVELIKQIKKEPRVLQAQPNHLFKTLSEPQQDLQHVYQTLHLTGVHQRYKGRGVRVAIVDTGVDIRHRDLSARVLEHVNLLKHNLYRGEIHGTAMAGVVLASINQFGIAGVAPQADLIALRACRQISENHPEGHCTTTSVSKALDTAIALKAQIVNMSFGASVPDFLMMQLFNEGAKRGVLFVAPVGNQKDKTKISFPASHSKVIAVGGVDERGEAYPNAALASAARVCAPAKEVLTTLPGNHHNIMNGTSISAAVVSGILALAKEKNSGLSIRTLPDYQGDLCLWQQALINLPVCN